MSLERILEKVNDEGQPRSHSSRGTAVEKTKKEQNILASMCESKSEADGRVFGRSNLDAPADVGRRYAL